MRSLLGVLAFLLLFLVAAPGRADLLTIAYTANSSGEYVPCPT